MSNMMKLGRDHKGAVLLMLARAALEEAFGGPHLVAPREPWLLGRAATFVTLRTKDGELRGCVGSIEPHRALGDDVISTARAAAFRDQRFDPLAPEELDEVVLEVSVLSPMVPLPVRSESALIGALVPRRDGVVLEWGMHRGLFLPKVWESLSEPEEFLAHLKMKAGLAADFWSEEIRVHTFTTEEFSEAAGDEQAAEA